MDLITKEIAKYIDQLGKENNKNFGDFGSDIVTQVFTDEPTDQIAVRAGSGPTPPRDPTSTPGIQILVRSKSPDVAERKIWEIHDLIDQEFNFWLTDYIFIYSILASNEPGSIGQDKKGNFLFSSNYNLRVKFY